MCGEELVQALSKATGLPEDVMTRELFRLLRLAGKPTHVANLDDIRDVLGDYLQSVLVQAKSHLSMTEKEMSESTILAFQDTRLG